MCLRRAIIVNTAQTKVHAAQNKAPPAPSEARPSVADRRQLGWICFAGLASAGVRGLHINHRLGSLLLDPYWVGFYVTNFQDGFRRRALLGTIFRLISPGGLSVVWINLLAMLALAGLLILFLRSILRLASFANRPAGLLLFAFFASALCSIFFEVMGDTLQLALLASTTLALLSARWCERNWLRLALAVAGLVLAFFIHEASAFLLVPCLPFLVSRKLVRRDFLLPVFLLGVLSALSLHWSSLDTHLTYHVLSVPRGLPLEGLATTPKVMDLLRHEDEVDFGSPVRIGFFLIRCCSIAALALAGLVALAGYFTAGMLRRFLAALITILVFSVPLWIIAHDWGRFLAYSFLLAAVAASTRHDLAWLTSQRWLKKCGDLLEHAADNSALQSAALLLLISSPYFQSRIAGMHIRDFLSSLVIVCIGLSSWMTKVSVKVSKQNPE